MARRLPARSDVVAIVRCLNDHLSETGFGILGRETAAAAVLRCLRRRGWRKDAEK